MRKADISYLECCLAHQHFPRMRRYALSTMVEMRDKRSTIPEPLSELARIMGFSNEQDTIGWLLIKGVPCDEKGAHIYKATLPAPWSEVELADVRKVPL